MNSAIRDTFLCFNFVVLLLDIVNAYCQRERALGMGNGEIADNQLESSSGDATLARRNNSEPWEPMGSDKEKWVQVDFFESVYVTAITTRGKWFSGGNNGFIDSYEITASYDKQYWRRVRNMQEEEIFRAGNIRTDYQRFSAPVSLRYIRIQIKTCERKCYLRFELYGCTALSFIHITSTETTSTDAKVLTTTITDDIQTKSDDMQTVAAPDTTVIITTTPTISTQTDKGLPEKRTTSSPNSASDTTVANTRIITTTPTISTQTDKEFSDTKPTISSTSATTNTNNLRVTETTHSVQRKTDGDYSTLKNFVEPPEAQLGSFSAPLVGGAIGGLIVLLVIITAIACVILRRKRSQPKTQSGLQYDGPYELTVEGSILPPTTPGPHTYQNTSNGVLSDEDNDGCIDINRNKNIDGETYAEIQENDANRRKRSSNKDGLVDIYAASQYGGRPSSTAADDQTENRHNAQSNSQLYAKVDRKKPKPGPRSDEAGSTRTSAEGWMDNDIYATDDAEDADSNGWRDNSIYTTTDNGDERDHREEGWEDNGIYAGGY